MQNIVDRILNYLRMDSSGALLISGKWGSGKTYFLKNEVFPIIKKDTNYKPIIISLYGEKDRAAIAKKIVFSFLESKTGDKKPFFKKWIPWVEKITDALPKLKEYIDLAKILEGSGENFLSMLPHDEILIVLDDLERLSESFQKKDLFGLVNDLVENYKLKVILVANSDELNTNDLVYKEKTIEKTLEYFPNFDVVLLAIKSKYIDSKFGSFLNEQTDFILNTIVTKTQNADLNVKLEISLSNIRTIKFAIEHFKYIFEIIIGDEELLTEIQVNQLRNIWIFVLSVSAEFKSNELSLRNKREIDEQATTFNELGFDLIETINETGEQVQESFNYSKNFKETYYSRLRERYVFYQEIYDFILGGFSIDREGFSKTLKEKFHIKEEGQEVKESYELLNSFMRGWWKLTSEEFIDSLSRLLSFCEGGEFDDSLDYLNSGNFLFEYSSFLGLEADEIKEKIKTGLTLWIDRCEYVFRDKSTLEMVKDQFVRPELIELIQTAEDLLELRQEQINGEAIQRVIDLFKSNFIEFVSQFVDKTNEKVVEYSSKSYLDRISEEDIKAWLEDISLPKVTQMDHLISSRYLKSGNLHNYLSEFGFLEKLQILSQSIGKGENSIEWYMLNRMVLPKVGNSITKIKAVRGSISRGEAI